LGTVQHEVSEILRGRILVGHALKHDLQVLMIRHPPSNIRDTSRYVFETQPFFSNKVIICILFRYKPFKKLVNGATPSLKLLTQTFLGIEIQSGEHSSVSCQFSLVSICLCASVVCFSYLEFVIFSYRCKMRKPP
jgi:RNA exonuclease 4